MNRITNPNIDILELAVERLGQLVDKMVFLGGCAQYNHFRPGKGMSSHHVKLFLSEPLAYDPAFYKKILTAYFISC